MGKHFEEKHGEDDIVQTSNNTDSNNEASKEKISLLKNNFQRLELMYHDSLEEVNQVKSVYEAKLIEANERVRMVKSENEELKEKVDVLFKLGRSYINRKDNQAITVTNEEEKEKTENRKSEEDIIEAVATENIGE